MPGIEFVERSSSQVTSVASGQSVATFVGQTKRGSSAKPLLLTSWKDFEQLYGGLSNANDLGVSLYRYFNSGGRFARVLRVLGDGAAGASKVLTSRSGGTALTAYASSEGAWGNDVNLNLALREMKTTAGFPNTEPRGTGDTPNRFVWAELPRLTGIVAGDVFDVYNTATGAFVGSVLTVGLDPSTSKACFYDLTSSVQNLVGNYTLRSNSRHLAQVRLAADLAGDTDTTTLDLSSTDGLSVGSLLTLQLASVCDTEDDVAVDENAYRAGAAVVKSIAGRRVTLESSFSPGATLWPAEVAARLYVPISATSHLKFVAVHAGAEGNRISVEITRNAVATAVTVTGTAIKVALITGGTVGALVAALTGNAAAAALVTTTAVLAGGDTQALVIANAVPVSMLTGGAHTTVTSQEFGLKVEINGTEPEPGRFDYLSTIPTSGKYFERIFGGELSPLAASDSNRSRLLILRGVDDTIDAGMTELLGMPRANSLAPLAGGADGFAPTDSQYIGQAEPRSGIYLLDDVVDSNVLLIPGVTSSIVARALVEYVEGRGDMLLLLDMPAMLETAAALSNYREFELSLNSSFVQLCAPFGKIRDPRLNAAQGAILEVPPSPEFAAAIARAASVGSHRSIGNFGVSWLTPSIKFQRADYNALNDQGINLVIANPSLGIAIGGDRTQAQDVDNPRRFGHNRRYLLDLRRRIEARLAIRTFVSITRAELNAIRSDIEDLLTADFTAGALFGDSAAQAFRVKCDFETTTVDDIRNATIGVEIILVLAALGETIRFSIDTRSGGVSSISEA